LFHFSLQTVPVGISIISFDTWLTKDASSASVAMKNRIPPNESITTCTPSPATNAEDGKIKWITVECAIRYYEQRTCDCDRKYNVTITYIIQVATITNPNDSNEGDGEEIIVSELQEPTDQIYKK